MTTKAFQVLPFEAFFRNGTKASLYPRCSGIYAYQAEKHTLENEWSCRKDQLDEFFDISLQVSKISQSSIVRRQI
jgi:hypothetical protein